MLLFYSETKKILFGPPPQKKTKKKNNMNTNGRDMATCTILATRELDLY